MNYSSRLLSLGAPASDLCLKQVSQCPHARPTTVSTILPPSLSASQSGLLPVPHSGLASTLCLHLLLPMPGALHSQVSSPDSPVALM